MKQIVIKTATLSLVLALFTMCVPPEDQVDAAALAEQKRLDSLRQVRCPRLLSSAAEYYKNRDWRSTVRVYREITEMGCDRGQEQEVYLYYAIAFEFLGEYDSSEYVLLKGLQKLPDDLPLRKRLAYAYKKQGKVNQEIVEYNKIIEIDSADTETMTELAKLYKDQGLYKDQIYILNKLLVVDPNNEDAISEIAIATEKIGGDPLDYYIQQVKDNPANISYIMNLARRFIDAGRSSDAIDYLKDGLDVDPNSKPLHRLLGEALYASNQLKEAALAYEELFKLDPRDIQLAIKISEIYVLDLDFGKGMRWANKAVSLDGNSGAAFAQKGNVYYKAFNHFRSATVNQEDRIVASLALQNYLKAEKLGYTRNSGNRRWLEENQKDVLFRKQEWFMLTPEQQSIGYVEPRGSSYDWIDEKLQKDSTW